jgi:hypothetical protein
VLKELSFSVVQVLKSKNLPESVNLLMFVCGVTSDCSDYGHMGFGSM